jgi:hypothetical protein
VIGLPSSVFMYIHVSQRLTASRSNVVLVDILIQVSPEVIQRSMHHMGRLIVFKPKAITLPESGRI